MTIAIYIAAVLAVLFIVSDAWPALRRWTRRRDRVAEFAKHYVAYQASRQTDSEGVINHFGPAPESERSRELRGWLVARRDEMQRDAQWVGRGVTHVAPPPMLGGGQYMPHPYFADLFSEQSYADYPAEFRRDELATVLHEVEKRVESARRDVRNPWAWLRLSFERVLAFPAWILRRAGFDASVTTSPVVRAFSVLWSALIGISTIGAFVVGLMGISG